jgi:hypothetical protein
VDDINGLVVSGRKKLDGRAPINEKLVELAHLVERGELRPDPSNAKLLRSLLEADDVRPGLSRRIGDRDRRPKTAAHPAVSLARSASRNFLR